jgi:ABC-type branched-subunit amino acid transport system ATPase component/ABC-type branched-subunit amino acid transport system permease subunit
MLYGMLAVGLLLVFRASKIINFAHGEIGAFGAAVLAATAAGGLPYWIAFLVAVAAAGAVGAGSEMLIVRRLQSAPLVISVVATLGLGQLLTIVSSVLANGEAVPQPSGFPTFDVGALLMTPAHVAMLVLTPVVVTALTIFLRRSRMGIAMRAAAANPDAARMAGMQAGRLSSIAWAIAGAVAAFTAILVLPTRGFSGGSFVGPGLLLRAFACAVIARMVSLSVAFVAGIALGALEQLLLANFPSSGSVELAIFVVVLGALLLQRNQGGRSEEKGTWGAIQAFSPLPVAMRTLPAIRLLGRTLFAVFVVVAAILPTFSSNETADILTRIAVYSLIGISVTLVTGLGGQLSLGQFAIAGVGAAASLQAELHGAPFLAGLVAAAVAGALVSLVIGLPSLRIQGLMLAVTTLSFALAAEAWFLQQPWMFGTGAAARRPTIAGFSFSSGKNYYYIALGTLVFGLWLARGVWISGVGRRMRAVRDNEEAARAFTIPATQVKLQVFVMGGILAGLGGALYSHMLGQVSSQAFPIGASINSAALAVIGGLGLLVGGLVGALYIVGIPEFVPLDNVGLLTVSAGWLFLLLNSPGGVGPMLAPFRERTVDFLARRSGLDPKLERSVTPGGGVGGEQALVLAGDRRQGAPHGSRLLVVEGLTKRFGGLVAVNGVTIEARAGEILGLIGPNGAGKTTLFEILGGFTKPNSGTIRFAGKDVTALRPEQRARLGLIRSFQDAALFQTMTVHETVMLSLERIHPTRFVSGIVGTNRRADRIKDRRADELLGGLGLMSFRDTKISALSTGSRRMTELACLIALEPTLLLLDEPTSGIAQRETEALGQLLLRIRDELDLTIVIIEHDIPLLMTLSDRVVAMEQGTVIAVGSPEEVQADPRVISSYLGGDVRAIERSTQPGSAPGHERVRVPQPVPAPMAPPARTQAPAPAPMPTAPVSMSGSSGPSGPPPKRQRCRAMSPDGARCLRLAGPDGMCGQHRAILARR